MSRESETFRSFCLANRRLLGGFVLVLPLRARGKKGTNNESARAQLRRDAYKNREVSRAGETLFVDLSRRGETLWALCTQNLPQNQCN